MLKKPHDNQGNLYPGACSRGQMPQIAPRQFAARQTQCVAPRAYHALDADRSIIQNGKLACQGASEDCSSVARRKTSKVHSTKRNACTEQEQLPAA